jgi:hypothetical protein
LRPLNADLVSTISLKRSTPKSPAIHKLGGRLPHLCPHVADRYDRRFFGPREMRPIHQAQTF